MKTLYSTEWATDALLDALNLADKGTDILALKGVAGCGKGDFATSFARAAGGCVVDCSVPAWYNDLYKETTARPSLIFLDEPSKSRFRDAGYLGNIRRRAADCGAHLVLILQHENELSALLDNGELRAGSKCFWIDFDTRTAKASSLD